MNGTRLGTLLIYVLGLMAAHAQRAVSVSPVKATGSKAVVKVELKKNFAEKIESVRAVCFLLDEHGKVVGQSTQWVIVGTKDRPALAADAKTTFSFVIPTGRVTPTTLTAKVSFNRLILAGGKVVDAAKNVEIKK